MKILVVIVSYNFERWIDRCLGSLRLSELRPDVVVIDNASQDQTVRIVENRYPEVRLVKNKKNLGFGRANNIGIRLAIEENYEAVFLLNQDAWIDKNVLGTLAQLSKTHPQYGILSPTHLTGSGCKLECGFAAYAGLGENITKELFTPPYDMKLIPISFVNAAFWWIPVLVLKKVGGFSSLFYHYGEDVDFVNRLHYHKYLVGYAPTVFACHDREHRETSRAAWFRSEEVYLLSEYANINYPFYKAFGYGVLAGVKKAWQALRRKDGSGCCTFLIITFRLLARTREVVICRHQNKQLNNYALHPHSSLCL